MKVTFEDRIAEMKSIWRIRYPVLSQRDTEVLYLLKVLGPIEIIEGQVSIVCTELSKAIFILIVLQCFSMTCWHMLVTC